jgi:monoamine oxidase
MLDRIDRRALKRLLSEGMSPLELFHLASQARIQPMLRRAASRKVDVIVVGAGMAGLAAANELVDRGYRVVVLEARDRVGGRAHTTRALGGVHIDEGAQYLHNPDRNPLTRLAEERGFDMSPADGSATFWFDGKALRDGEEGLNGAWEREFHVMMAAVREAAGRGRDVPITDVYVNPTPLGRMVLNDMGSLTLGVDPEEISTTDLARKVEESHGLDDSRLDQFLTDGMGTFVESFAHGLPIELGVKVDRIDHRKNDVVVRTNAGEFRGRRVLVTVPVGVLTAGDIAFDPPFTPERVAALGGMQMSRFKKVYLRFDPETFTGKVARSAIYDLEESRIAFLIGAGGKDGLVFGMLGGGLSGELGRSGDAATVEAMLARLEKMFGPRIRASFRGAWISPWDDDPLSRGSYAVAKPGHQGDRLRAALSIGGKVFFAGEAYDEEWPTYLPGAHRSGIRAASEIAGSLGQIPAAKR